MLQQSQTIHTPYASYYCFMYPQTHIDSRASALEGVPLFSNQIKQFGQGISYLDQRIYMFRLIVERTDIAVFVKNGERHRAHLDTLGYLGRP